MSRAFVKENDGDAAEDWPERAQSPHPNYVTPRGLALLRERLLAAQQQRATASSEAARTAIDRELRWLQARIASARLVTPEAQPRDRIAFGARVRLIDENGQSHDYRLVGEDEAEPERGRISWISPLAQALLGARVGDIVSWSRPAGTLEVEVQAIDYAADAQDRG